LELVKSLREFFVILDNKNNSTYQKNLYVFMLAFMLAGFATI